MIHFMYLHVTLPGIVGCDTAKTLDCPGLVNSSQFPTFDCGAPCARNDEAALLEYLPNDYNSLGADGQAAALKEAKDRWRQEKYGAGRELSCCVEGDSDCPDVLCEELGDTWAHYCNAVGMFMLECVKLVIGGQQVDKMHGLFLFCWEELCGKSGRRLTELVGRRYTRGQLVCDSREGLEMFIPLPFYFTLDSGSALPLASLAYHGVQLQVEFARLEKLVVVSGPHVAVRNAKTGLALTAQDLKAEMEITYVYLDTDERAKFSTNSHEQLMIQTQSYFKSESKQTCRIPLSFNHPCLALMFGVRRQCNELANNWGNLSGIDGRDSIQSAELLLNTSSRFGKKNALYWRSVVPYQHFSNIPEAFIYVMSFAMTPEKMVPSGSCNLSRIDNIELVLEMQPNLGNETFTVFVFARTFNLMKFANGVGGPMMQ